MAKGILGRKIGMTQVFAENGDLIPVTVIEATPNVVLQKKTVDTDGYEAIQIGFEDKREKLSNKPSKGHDGCTCLPKGLGTGRAIDRGTSTGGR